MEGSHLHISHQVSKIDGGLAHVPPLFQCPSHQKMRTI